MIILKGSLKKKKKGEGGGGVRVGVECDGGKEDFVLGEKGEGEWRFGLSYTTVGLTGE